MPNKLDLLEVIDRLEKFYQGQVHIDGPTYISIEKPARFIDVEYGDWWICPRNLIYEYKKKMHRDRFFNKLSIIKRTPIEIIKEKLTIVHKGILSLKEDTYIDASKKCTFVDIDFGPFEANPNSVLSKKKHGHPERGKLRQQSTCLKKYGVKNANQDPEIALKVARSANKIIDLIHWKTGEILPCQASYEVAVVNYFNSNKIDFQWQNKITKNTNIRGIFDIPTEVPGIGGKTYTMDAYLPELDKYIEIKGYFWNDAEAKWNWFHKKYPNSELWDKDILVKMNLMPKYHRKKKT